MTITRDDIRSSAVAKTAAPRVRIIAWFIGIVGVLVSALGSWGPSLWGDEAASILSATRSIPSLINMLGHVDVVHGTYYLGLHAWVEVFGSSPFAVRFPSALAIGVCVAGVVLLGTKLDSLKLGVLAGIICAVLPRVTAMGDEARSYAFSAAIATWLTLLFVDMIQRQQPSRKQWVLYGAGLAVGIYVFLYLALIAVAHFVILFSSANTRAMLRSWIRTVLVVGFSISPLLIIAVLQRSQIAFLGQQSNTDFASIAVKLWFATPVIAVLCWAAIVAALGFFLNGVLRKRFTSVTFRDSTHGLTLVAAAWLFVPLIVLYLSHFLVPDFTARYLSMCAPAAALLIAAGIAQLVKFRTIPIILVSAVLITSMLPNWIEQRGPYAKNNSDWALISSEIATHAQPGDAIAFDDSTPPSKRTRLAMRTYPDAFVGLRDVTLKTPYFASDSWYDDAYSFTAAQELGRFDDVTSLWLIDYATPKRTNMTGVAELRALGFTETLTINNHRSVVRHFER